MYNQVLILHSTERDPCDRGIPEATRAKEDAKLGLDEVISLLGVPNNIHFVDCNNEMLDFS
jgi:hypothetical protein